VGNDTHTHTHIQMQFTAFTTISIHIVHEAELECKSIPRFHLSLFN